MNRLGRGSVFSDPRSSFLLVFGVLYFYSVVTRYGFLLFFMLLEIR